MLAVTATICIWTSTSDSAVQVNNDRHLPIQGASLTPIALPPLRVRAMAIRTWKERLPPVRQLLLVAAAAVVAVAAAALDRIPKGAGYRVGDPRQPRPLHPRLNS